MFSGKSLYAQRWGNVFWKTFGANLFANVWERQKRLRANLSTFGPPQGFKGPNVYGPMFQRLDPHKGLRDTDTKCLWANVSTFGPPGWFRVQTFTKRLHANVSTFGPPGHFTEGLGLHCSVVLQVQVIRVPYLKCFASNFKTFLRFGNSYEKCLFDVFLTKTSFRELRISMEEEKPWCLRWGTRNALLTGGRRYLAARDAAKEKPKFLGRTLCVGWASELNKYIHVWIYTYIYIYIYNLHLTY